MPIEIETVLTPEDYDAALNKPRRSVAALSFLIVAGVVISIFASVGTSLVMLSIAIAGVIHDRSKLEQLLHSGRLSWIVPTLLVMLPFTAWFLLHIFRLSRHSWRMLTKPKDVRLLRMGLHLGPTKFTLSPVGFAMRKRDMRLLLPWKAFADVEDAPGRLRFPLAASDGAAWRAGMFIPRHAFASDLERLEALRYAKKFIREARI